MFPRARATTIAGHGSSGLSRLAGSGDPPMTAVTFRDRTRYDAMVESGRTPQAAAGSAMEER